MSFLKGKKSFQMPMKINLQQNIYINLLITIAITIWALIQNQITVFYMLYLFWWQEMITIIFEIIYYYKTNKTLRPIIKNIRGRLFMMGIYLVFIVVVFGFIIGFKPMETFIFNMETLLFKNVYFVANIIFFMLSMIMMNKNELDLEEKLSPFSLRMIVLHISIILGAIIGLFILNKMNSNHYYINKWASVLSAVPFLLIRLFIDLKMAREA